MLAHSAASGRLQMSSLLFVLRQARHDFPEREFLVEDKGQALSYHETYSLATLHIASRISLLAVRQAPSSSRKLKTIAIISQNNVLLA